MGQAKRRGDYDDRRNAAILRDQAERDRLAELESLRRARMTPEEREAEFDRQYKLASILALASQWLYYAPPPQLDWGPPRRKGWRR